MKIEASLKVSTFVSALKYLDDRDAQNQKR